MSGIHLIGTIGGHAVALPADTVEAVVRIEETVTVPGAPSSVRGLAAIRSRILTVIDSACVVGDPGGRATYMAIVSVDGHGYGLTLDTVEDVVELGATQVMPATLSAGWAQLDPRICDHRGRVLLVVDPEALIAAASASRLKAA